MDFVGAIKAGFKNYVNFRGTATRPEFWYWFLFTVLVGIVLGAVDQSGNLGTAASAALFLPSLGVAVRRLRDAGFSWLWLLLPLVGIPGFSIGMFQFVNQIVIAGVTVQDLENPELIDQNTLNALMANETLVGAVLLMLFSALYIALAFFVVQVIMPIRKTKTFEQGNKRVASKGPENPVL